MLTATVFGTLVAAAFFFGNDPERIDQAVTAAAAESLVMYPATVLIHALFKRINSFEAGFLFARKVDCASLWRRLGAALGCASNDTPVRALSGKEQHTLRQLRRAYCCLSRCLPVRAAARCDCFAHVVHGALAALPVKRGAVVELTNAEVGLFYVYQRYTSCECCSHSDLLPLIYFDCSMLKVALALVDSATGTLRVNEGAAERELARKFGLRCSFTGGATRAEGSEWGRYEYAAEMCTSGTLASMMHLNPNDLDILGEDSGVLDDDEEEEEGGESGDALAGGGVGAAIGGAVVGRETRRSERANARMVRSPMQREASSALSAAAARTHRAADSSCGGGLKTPRTLAKRHLRRVVFTEIERMFANDEIGIDALPHGAAPRMRLVPLPPLRPTAEAAEGGDVSFPSNDGSSSSSRISSPRRLRAGSSRSATPRRSTVSQRSSPRRSESRRSTFFYTEDELEDSANAGVAGAARARCCALSPRKRLRLALAIVRGAKSAPAKLFLAVCTRKRKVVAEALVDAPRVLFAVEMMAAAEATPASDGADGSEARELPPPPPLDIWGAATVLELRARIWQRVCAAPGLRDHHRSLHQVSVAPPRLPLLHYVRIRLTIGLALPPLTSLTRTTTNRLPVRVRHGAGAQSERALRRPRVTRRAHASPCVALGGHDRRPLGLPAHLPPPRARAALCERLQLYVGGGGASLRRPPARACVEREGLAALPRLWIDFNPLSRIARLALRRVRAPPQGLERRRSGLCGDEHS